MFFVPPKKKVRSHLSYYSRLRKPFRTAVRVGDKSLGIRVHVSAKQDWGSTRVGV